MVVILTFKVNSKFDDVKFVNGTVSLSICIDMIVGASCEVIRSGHESACTMMKD